MLACYNALIARLPIKRERVPTTTAVASVVVARKQRSLLPPIFDIPFASTVASASDHDHREVVLLVIPHLLLALQHLYSMPF